MTHDAQQPTVIVGVKGTGNSGGTIRLAAQEARHRKASLIAVMAYSSERPPGAPGGRPLATLHTAGDARLVAESALRDAVAEALGALSGACRPGGRVTRSARRRSR